MASTVRDIIIEALNRTGVCSRRQSAPANIVEDAYNLLKGITAQYGNDNVLSFAMGEADVENPPERVSISPDVRATIQNGNVAKINGIFYRFSREPQVAWNELKFVGIGDFYNSLYSGGVWTCKADTDTAWTIYLRSEFVAMHPTIKVMWNERFDYDLNSTLYIPPQYVELFTVALCCQLATTYPRVSDTQLANFKAERERLENNIHAPNRAVKYISNANGNVSGYLGMGEMLSGSFLGL